MFTTSPQPSAPTLLSTTTVAAPASPGPSNRSRLRGLSYLRNYTQSLHVRGENDTPRTKRPAFPRAQSQPSPPSPSAETFAHDQEQITPPSPSQAQAQHTPSPPNSSGWLPAPAGRSGTARPTIRQQSTPSEASSSEPAPTVTTTAQSVPTIPIPMTRNRADTAAPVLSVRQQSTSRTANADDANEGANSHPTLPSIRFIPHFDPRANRPSLSFPAITRTLPGESSVIRVGRYSERENPPETNPSVPSHSPVGFKSKVVSRRHCEFWCQNNQWYIRDVKSSSGTFLNHLRLSPPGVESRAYAVNDGDVVQLGIDFRGGEEMIFRCVKIRIECNRGWQKALNNFNKKTHKQLRNLTRQPKKDSDTASVNTSECAICLMSIAPCQSLFVAPCSHVWHYKCIRPILNGHTWPNFLCPNCRAVADLEADVEEQEEEWEEESIEAAMEASRQDTTSGPDVSDGTPDVSPAEDPNTTMGAPLSAVSSVNSANEETQHSLPLRNAAATTTSTTTSTTRGMDVSNQPSVSSTTTPRPIPLRAGPSGNTYELTVGPPGHEGPLTPRNDAGPFVLDGGAGTTTAGDGRVVGRTTGSIRRSGGFGNNSVQSLDATAAEVGLGHV